MDQSSYEVRAIGIVESELTDPTAAPNQGNEGAPDAWLVFEPDVEEALYGLKPGQEVFLFSWLHRGRRDVLKCHPRDDLSVPEQGVFNTRSSERPNPIGLHRVEILSIEDGRMHVRPLEAVDGTPIVDVKPVIRSEGGRR